MGGEAACTLVAEIVTLELYNMDKCGRFYFLYYLSSVMLYGIIKEVDPDLVSGI